MLSLYLDDAGSSNSAGETVFVMGGCIATAQQWEKFEIQWDAACREAGIKAFHPTDFFARKVEPFKSWPNKTHAEFARRFAAIAETHFATGVGRGVDAAAFNRVVSPEQFVVRGFELFGVQVKGFPALMFCARTCMEWIGHWWPGRPKNEGIAVVLDDGPGVGAAIEYFRFMKKNDVPWSRPFRSFTTTEKAGLSPLQAACYVAYETRLELAARTKSPRPAPRPSFERLTQRDRVSIRIASESGLTQYVEELRRAWIVMQMEKELSC